MCVCGRSGLCGARRWAVCARAPRTHLADPRLVAALQEAEHERLFAEDLLHADDLDLAGRARHRRAARRAAEARRGADGVGVEALRARERHVEEVLRAGVTRHEHVVRHDAEAHLREGEGVMRVGV